MIVYNSESGQEVASLPADGRMNGVYYDAQHKRIYITCGRDLPAGFEKRSMAPTRRHTREEPVEEKNMRKLCPTLVVLFAGLALFVISRVSPTAAQEPSRELAPLQLIQRIPAPGVSGRIDHFTAYPKRRLLIFAALGNNTVEVVNTFEGKVVQSIKGLNEPQGVLYVPEFNKLFVANAGNGNVNVYDGKTWALRKSILLGEEADTDNLRYDEATKRVFVGIVGGIAMIDAATETHVGKDLKGSGGHSESFQLEKKGSRVFVNVPDDDSIVNVIDRKTGELTKWGLERNQSKLSHGAR